MSHDRDSAASPSGVPLDACDSRVGQVLNRYRIDGLIAEGGEGLVFRVTDMELHRCVAMKVLKSPFVDRPECVERFLVEARRTSSLQHPGIPAVHEVGSTQTGDVYFTMRLVEGQDLRAVLMELSCGDQSARGRWSLLRLVQVLQSVANTVDYAHSRGLVHRDLKPENIAVGEFGEVIVLDWGIAKRITTDPHTASEVPSENLLATIAGAVKGTPLYMAPEQAWGRSRSTDRRTDVFALGALLYEMLCLQPPYEGTSFGAVLSSARTGAIRSPFDRFPDRDFPRVLVDVAMRALALHAEERHQSAREFADELQSYIDGTREQELRAEETALLLREARELVGKCREYSQAARAFESESEALRDEIPPWSSPAEKKALWALEDRAERLRVQAAEVHSEAVELVSRCLSQSPDDPAARGLMGKLYATLLRKAEESGDSVETAWLRRKVDAYNDGTLDAELRRSGTIDIRVQPPQSRLTVAPWIDRARRLRLGEPYAVKVREQLLDLPSGSYQLSVSHPGRTTANVPLYVARGPAVTVDIELPCQERLPRGFVWVPRGAFLCGRRPRLTSVDVADFLIQERPVLLREYAQWLDALVTTDPDAAARHAPGTGYQGAMLVVEGGRHVMRSRDRRPGRSLDDLPDFPVVAISQRDAQSYGAWLGKRLSIALRLPSEVEWEKAARGTDGRLYPWGERFDASFCSMASSFPSEPRLRPVQRCKADVSPYGVRDMAGGVHEWCSRSRDTARRTCPSRGGAWYSQEEECTVASRWLVEPTSRSTGIGFRLAADLA